MSLNEPPNSNQGGQLTSGAEVSPPMQVIYSPQNSTSTRYPPPHSPPNYIPMNCSPTAIVITQPGPVRQQTFEHTQVQTVCPNCGAEVITSTGYSSGSCSWLICVVLFLCGCSMGCCLIPFCIDDIKDVVHTCPNCKVEIARWNRL